MRSLFTPLRLAVAAATLTVSVAPAAVITFSSEMTTGQEVPAPNLSGAANPLGSATAIFDTEARTLQGTMSWSGLTSSAFMAHIHLRPPAAPTGPVLITYFMLPPESPLGTTGSINTGTLNLTEAQYNGLVAGLPEGRLYFNLHTLQNRPGEIRGDISPQAVPEPGTWALLTAGLAGILLRAKRRRA